MWLPFSAIATICLLMEILDLVYSGHNMDSTFRERTHSDWIQNWHTEKHIRCRETIKDHMDWACAKDIYRLIRRSPNVDYDTYDEEQEVFFPWQTRSKAKRMLRFKRNVMRRSGWSITNECCKSTGCTWEEYAEYCPNNKRYTS